jgi:small subunit ribosomal protein S17
MRQRTKRREGIVVSAKMTRTVVVQVRRLVQHPVYGKRIQRHQRFLAHDEKGECREGDRVAIIETRPLSRLKRWRISQILSRAAG